MSKNLNDQIKSLWHACNSHLK